MDEPKKENSDLNKLVVHNIKNPLFRTVHVDGVIGGITPTGLVNMNFYCQRNSIPKGSVFEKQTNGSLKLINHLPDSKDGIIRELEFGVYLDLNTCKRLQLWLGQRIVELANREKK